MKNVMTLFLLMASFSLFAQTQSSLQKEFSFENGTEEKEISFPTNTGTMGIHFFFKSEISKGELKINIYDPNGKKEGGFHLEAVSKKKALIDHKNQEENVISYTVTEDGDNLSSGSMNKSISKPIPGTWRVKIMAKDLNGALGIQIKQTIED